MLPERRYHAANRIAKSQGSTPTTRETGITGEFLEVLPPSRPRVGTQCYERVRRSVGGAPLRELHPGGSDEPIRQDSHYVGNDASSRLLAGALFLRGALAEHVGLFSSKDSARMSPDVTGDAQTVL